MRTHLVLLTNFVPKVEQLTMKVQRLRKVSLKRYENWVFNFLRILLRTFLPLTDFITPTFHFSLMLHSHRNQSRLVHDCKISSVKVKEQIIFYYDNKQENSSNCRLPCFFHFSEINCSFIISNLFIYCLEIFDCFFHIIQFFQDINT